MQVFGKFVVLRIEVRGSQGSCGKRSGFLANRLQLNLQE